MLERQTSDRYEENIRTEEDDSVTSNPPVSEDVREWREKKNRHTGKYTLGTSVKLLHEADDFLSAQTEEIKRLREALEFYAAEENHEVLDWDQTTEIRKDEGRRARAALSPSPPTPSEEDP